MKYNLFGMDARQPERFARVLREKGYSGVIGGAGNEKGVQAAADQGLTYDLSVGAFGLGGGFSRPALDCEGIERRWFSSGCPSDRAMRAARLEQYEQLAAQPGVRAVIVDGARFASFASQEGVDSFFTCFCPECMRAAEEMGFDPARMLSGARALKRFTQTGEGDEKQALTGVGEWLAFRQESVSRFLRDFARAVHRQGKLAGAFVFAPSLSRWVGQAAAEECGLDILSPMIYRRYRASVGPACLNHEWAALIGLLTEKSGLSRQEAARLTHAPELPEDILRDGFDEKQVERETRALFRPEKGCLLSPILQRDDERLLPSLRAAQRGGAQEISLFAYDTMDNLPDLRAMEEEEA